MKPLYLALLSFLFLLFSCTSAKVNKDGYILNHDLSVSLENYDKSLDSERSELLFSGGGTAKNCSTYFNLMFQYDLDESVYNQTVKSEYLVCDALRILSGSSIVFDTKANDFGEKLSLKLDLRSFPSSLFRICDEKKHTLKSLYPKNVTSKNSLTVLETEDWIFQLEVVGVAQLNDNFMPDWIVWLSDEAKLGNYRSYTTLIVYDPDNQEKYIATSYP